MFVYFNFLIEQSSIISTEVNKKLAKVNITLAASPHVSVCRLYNCYIDIILGCIYLLCLLFY